VPELWRKRKNHKPVGSWLVTLDKKRINLLTKDANLARERAQMAQVGLWPPPKGMTKEQAHAAFERDTAAAAADAALEATEPTRVAMPEPPAPPPPAPAPAPEPPTSAQLALPPAPSPKDPPPPTPGEPVKPDQVIPPASAADDAAAAAAEATGDDDGAPVDDSPAAGSASLDDLLAGFGMDRDDLVELLGIGHTLLCDKLAGLISRSSAPVSNKATEAVAKFAGPALLACVEKRLSADVQLSPEMVVAAATVAGVGVRLLAEVKAPPQTSSSSTNGASSTPRPAEQPVPTDQAWTAGLELS
jgi:hypothetical protein